MAARTPPPLVSAPIGNIDRPTTTVSTIVVKAGNEAFITVGLLQSGSFARLRIDEMRPPILSVGRNGDENRRLLEIHQEMMGKLGQREAECEALLARAAALPEEKGEEEKIVYTAMASSLDCTWRELLRRLQLRENLLVDIGRFYRLMEQHQEVSRVCISSISSLSQSQSPDGLARQIGMAVNEMVDLTAQAMEIGSSVMGQIRILGETSDGEGREEEIYRAMLNIEEAMLKMSSEWSRVEGSWEEEKRKRREMSENGGDAVDRELEEIGLWLEHARKRLKASTEEGLRTILAETEEQRTRLITVISQTEDDRKLARAGELARGVEELLALTKAALNKGSRLRNFFTSANNMYQQLCGMERDMVKANESMAGELAPLARQKGTSLKEEADSIIERERVTYEEKRLISAKRDEILAKVDEIERLAREKGDEGKMQARENLRRAREWMVREGEPWMERSGQMGETIESAEEFVRAHEQFGETIVANDEAIQFALQESSRLTEEEYRSAMEFEERYNNLKSQLEQRLYVGKTFHQVQEFARELEISFNSLENLIDQKAEHSERGLEQMGKVFQMIEDTLGQERQQGDRFISSAESLTTTDLSLKSGPARDRVREIVVRHERRLSEMGERWMNWHVKKHKMVDASRILEEVQMWQEETIEIIRLWEEKTRAEEHTEEERFKLAEVVRKMDGEKERVESVRKTVEDETTLRRLEETMERQREIERRMEKVQSAMVEEEKIVLEKRKELDASSQHLHRTLEEVQMWQEQTIEVIRLWEARRREVKEEERQEIQTRSTQMKADLVRENEKIETVKTMVQDDSTRQRVLETVLKQREIGERIENVERRMNEEVKIYESEKKATEERARRTVEEISQWQEEIVTILRLWEDYKQKRSESEKEDINKSIEAIRMDAGVQKERLESVSRAVEDIAFSTQVSSVAQQMELIGQRMEKIQKEMREESEREVQLQVQLKKTLEEVEMWQEETVEIIRLWSEKKVEEKKVQVEEVRAQFAEVGVKIQECMKVVKDEDSARRLERITVRQNDIVNRVEEEQREAEKEAVVLTQLKQSVEEIEMWQEETVEIMRLWAEKKVEEKKIEEVITKMEAVNAKIRDQMHAVKDEATAKRVERIALIQMEIAEKIQARQQQIMDEIEMWQEESFEIIRLWAEKKVEEKKIEEVKQKMEATNAKIRDQLHAVKDESTSRRLERIGLVQIEIAEKLQIALQKRVLDEIEMWQEETVEIIRLWGEKKTIEEKKVVIEEISAKLEAVNAKIRDQLHAVKDESTRVRVENVILKQREITAKLQTITQQLTSEIEALAVETVKEVIERPKITTQLVDISIEEGKRVEFVAKIDSKPEATVMWLKDGAEIGQSMEYRKSYVNGVATLSIEETFIEDSATYTLKATNEGGVTESSATLTVTSVTRSDAPPRVIRGLQSRAVEEGEELFLDCVVVAIPEPQVVWFKEETTIKEDERTRLDFKGDHCSLTLSPTTVADSGMYTAKAKNIHGEATSLCQVKVAPKKVPPPPPPKPERSESRLAGPLRPPSMQNTLTNESYTEGMRAVLQVLVSGCPPPAIQWFINDAPVTTTERVKITIEEDGWTRLIIDSIREEDAGLYMVVAENESGEARTGATLHVQSRTVLKHSVEEASGSEQIQTTVVEAAPIDTERITVVENHVETNHISAPAPSTVKETTTNATEEFSQKEENEIEVRPIQREETNTTITTVTTTSNSHIPIATTTKTKRDSFVQGEIGLSNTSTAPDLIRGLQTEYTVNEEEELFLEVLLVANPRPKVEWFFNDNLIPPTSQVVEISSSADSYSLRVKKSGLQNAGYYRVRVENVRGVIESQCIVHIRPAALGPAPKIKQHVTVQEEFAMFEYEQRRPDYLYESRIPTLKNDANHHTELNKKTAEYLEGYDHSEKQRVGNPPHFTQTLLSTVTADGAGAKFEGIVTGWPVPSMEWAKDDVIITRQSHPHITLSNIGGRVALNLAQCTAEDCGKYKCTASNEWGVATSSAQLVVRPKTVAPDFISRLISEEIGEEERLKWTVRVSGDPLPSVVWLRDGIVIPNCDEVQIIDEGDGVHSMIIHSVEMADSGQFTCLAENSAGEARSTADLVVRPVGAEPGHYFHVTKVTQEKQVKGQPVAGGRNETYAIQSPIV